MLSREITFTDQICSICLNGIVDQDVAIPNKCDHVFCNKCLKKWKLEASTCPNCRKSFASTTLYNRVNGIYKIRTRVLENKELVNTSTISIMEDVRVNLPRHVNTTAAFRQRISEIRARHMDAYRRFAQNSAGSSN